MVLSKTIWRIPLLAGGIFVLVAGLWGGLLRIGWIASWPAVAFDTVTFHGALMVGGFLGTLISLERAVALGRLWTYASPIAAALGGLCLILGLPPFFGQTLLLIASLVLVAIFTWVVIRQPAMFTVTMGLGAVAWAVGNALWLANWSIPAIVAWWVAFLVLTIVGERLELSRFLAPLRGRHAGFAAAVGPYLLGLILSLFWPGLGWVVSGVGMLGMALWLLIHDLARQTVRRPGLARFIALCLLSGYFWLATAGGLAINDILIQPLIRMNGWSWMAHTPVGGFAYDSMLHAVLLGFVFAMIFGHAPIIFPAVLDVRMKYHPRFYAHLILLEVGVALRIIADLMAWPQVRAWAGLIAALAIILFLIQSITSISRRPAVPAGSTGPRPGALPAQPGTLAVPQVARKGGRTISLGSMPMPDKKSEK